MDRSISIPNHRCQRQLSTSSSASSFGSMDSSTYSSSPYPILNAPPPNKKSSSNAISNTDDLISRPRPRRRLSSVYSNESNISGSSEVCVNEEDSSKWNGSMSASVNDKYSVFDSLRRTDSSYKGWSKEVLGLGPYGWSEEILEGGYESTDSAFSNSSEDGFSKTPHSALNPFLQATTSTSPSTQVRNFP